MHRSETRELTLCADCRAEFSPAHDRGYSFAESAVLCFDCAVRRGGRWDEVHDRWETNADVGDLDTAES